MSEDGRFLSARPSEEEIRGYRHQMMESVSRLVDKPDGLHLYDALHKLGLPRAMFLANASDPVVANWLKLSRGRTLVNAPGEMPDLETIKERNALGMSAAGLGEKLAIMVALSDPLDRDEWEMIIKLAELQTKLLPKKTTVTTDAPNNIADSELRDELRRLRKQREELLDMQEQALDANTDEPDGQP